MFEIDIEGILEKNPEINLDKNKYNINVTSNNGLEIDNVAVNDEFSKINFENSDIHLYFHYPLCYYICKFCNYVKKSTSKQSDEISLWVNLLIKESEIKLKANPTLAKANVESIYFGGGTASIMKEDNIRILLEHIRENYQLVNDCEISLEGNPDDFIELDFEKLNDIGINRYSLGVQSLEDKVSQYTNRKHTALDSVNAINKLRMTGHPFNVDIMFGLPFQNEETVKNDIETLINLDVPSITLYRFRNSKREKMDIGKKSMWSNENILKKVDHLFPTLSETYHYRKLIVDKLMSNNYFPSPCSWWTKKGTYAEGIPRVSKNKWQDYKTMIAFGPGAYGWITEEKARYIQTHNDTNFRAYQEKVMNNQSPFTKGRVLENEVSLVTRLGFAFKANQSISIYDYQSEFGEELVENVLKPILKILEDKKFIYYLSPILFQPTLIGEAVHEEIISEIIHGFIKSEVEVCKR